MWNTISEILVSIQSNTIMKDLEQLLFDINQRLIADNYLNDCF